MSSLAPDPAAPHPAWSADGIARPVDEFARVRGVCPLLRSREASWSSVHASRDLLCWAVSPAAQLTLLKQRQLCVTAEHTACATYLAALAADALLAGPTGGESLLWPAAGSVLTILEPTHGRANVPITAPKAGGQAVLVAIMLVAFIVLAIARTGPANTGGASPSPAPTPAPSAAASALAGASAQATPSPTASPSARPSAEPTPSASPAASSGATAPPTASASPRTYKVRSGDTLALIAAKFHTTVKAIVAANKIADPRTIHPGQTLVIP